MLSLRRISRCSMLSRTAGFQDSRGPALSPDREDGIGTGVVAARWREPTPAVVMHKNGIDLLHDPWYNKGTAFSATERDRLNLRGLLPPRQLSFEVQKQRVMADYARGVETKSLDEVDETLARSGITSESIRKWRTLQSLQDRNETLFYRLLVENFVEMAPIIYTPTVGWACQNYSKMYRRPRGMFFSAQDKGEMSTMVWNWPSQIVDAVVVTDGSRILGLGDLGINGMGIPIGKLDLYVAAAGFHPDRVLPVVIDVGTNNAALRADPFYMGLDHPRITGDEYYQLLDEFMAAIHSRWPRALIQFEDFNMEHALPLLQRYRHDHLVFNDDIQGTAATALAGVYGGLAVQGMSTADLLNQRIVVTGAGSAGMGVVTQLHRAMLKHGLTAEDAATRFYILDANGLITTARKSVPRNVYHFARLETESEGMNLLEVVNTYKPTVMLGLSTVGGLFSEQVLKAMNRHSLAASPPFRPIVFPMSNPTSNSECTAAEAAHATGGRAIFASGSPFADVEFEGHTIASSQANNVYIFPGLALGAHLGGCKRISNRMLMKAAESLAAQLTPDECSRGAVYPYLGGIRKISHQMACDVIEQAADDGVIDPSSRASDALMRGREHLESFVKERMFYPEYASLVYLPSGIGE